MVDRGVIGRTYKAHRNLEQCRLGAMDRLFLRENFREKAFHREP